MANSSDPLLCSQSDNVLAFGYEEEQHPNPNDQHLPSLDSTIERCIGDFGWPQFLQALLASFAWAFDAQQTFISVFTDAEPSWHCTTTHQLHNTSTCNVFSNNICQIPKDSWTWDFPKHTSIISEWGLECAGSIMKGLPESSFFMGCLVGGLVLATLADSSLGRKNMIFLGSLVMSLSALSTAFSNNIWIYSALRFICGCGRAIVGTSALVLSTELVGKKWRGHAGTIGFFCFTLGFLSLPAMAYIIRGSSWRIMYLWTSIPTLLYCIVIHLLVYESPRWLFVRGRKEEAIATLKSMSSLTLNIMSFSSVALEEKCNVDFWSTLKMVVEQRWPLRRLAIVTVIGFGIGMVYYGMPLSLGNLAYDLYLSVTLNALSELPAALVSLAVIGKMKRKTTVMVFSVLSGVCSAVTSVLMMIKGIFIFKERIQMGVELVSFFSACTAFNVLLIYTIELFQTCVRNSTMSMLRQAVVFGGVFGPVLAAGGRDNGSVSFCVFGLVIGFCGLFVVFLPETRGRPLCDTMEEEEHRLSH
ncbi:hypothetical protein FNV43_RR09507 [Rhamnella rubrinervis]|uniref:Major facilitator superfamily (MFS) profile domain-containing protein n=1 Tax=Rhamnella rubrinervis TaxID=2594499 RepID=A0A8K0HAU0_9ROSA|nr:hypothetical protein FNV43_RR09507 [Rhamnella rubrinervis]